MTKQVQLTVDNLYCSRNQRPLFSPVSFKLSTGELLHIKGANGIGKTTLLRCLAGFLQPTQGDIIWSEAIKASPDAQMRLAYVGHRSGHKTTLTVYENLKLSPTVVTPVSDEQINVALEYVGLHSFRHHRVFTLSAGQSQRLTLARLMITDTALWLLDEPFNSLDTEGSLLLVSLIEQFRRSGGCVLLSSHVTLPELQSHSILELQQPEQVSP